MAAPAKPTDPPLATEPAQAPAFTPAAPANGPLVTAAAVALPPIRLKPDVDPAARFRDQSASLSDAAVVGGEQGYDHHYFLPGDFPTVVAATAHRQRIVDEGFEPCNGPYYSGPPRKEYVPAHGEAEIWRRPKSAADAAFLAQLTRVVLNPQWAAQHHRHPRGSLPPAVETAMYFFHGILKPDQLPEGVKKPTEAQLRDLVWSHVKPHPGGTRSNPYAWSK